MEKGIFEKVDNRQFIIMEEPYHDDNFLYVQLSKKKILSYNKGLKVKKYGKRILLGNAFPVITGLTLSDIELKTLPYFAGRWILIDDNIIYLDACGSLGLYYTQVDNQIVISSSLHLISVCTGKKWEADYKAEAGKGGLLDYYPIPYTPYKGVKKLLPSQTISLQGEISFRSNYMVPRYDGKSVDELLRNFIDAMSCEMINISKEYGNNIWVSLTGGYDSRVNVAVAKYSGIDFHVYTALRESLKKSDLIRAKQVCKKLKIKHETIDDRVIPENAKQREKVFDLHTGGHITFGTEKKQFIAGSDVNEAKNSIVLWGTLWAMTYKAYSAYMKANDEKSDIYKEISRWASESMLHSWVHQKSISEWIDYTLLNPVDGMDWRQRLYWEERNGAWVSAAQQGLDLLDSVRIAPINCQYLIELLLSFPEELQHDKAKEKMLVDRCCKKLSKIPYGEFFMMELSYKVIRKIQRFGRLLSKGY